ncbi:hypothetical protein Ppb6_03629 [Photorhabdus australis subsp. thailandensis]|uniref:Uncharacterized protein n=1 Tax=Photorhabdus australis subsp. thailandensis TaxID=2805096 RepID=A0A1C0TZX7_9GAMM|nr:hypothetical protein Ppb6_03629 [Photorhabdus australis subsp. thailandensis]
MRSLQIVRRIGHFSHQRVDPVVQLNFKQTPILGGADVFPLDQFQIMGNARQQEDIRQTRVDAAVRCRFTRVVYRWFLRRVSREEAGVIAVFVVRERNKAQIGKFKLAGFRDHHF